MSIHMCIYRYDIYMCVCVQKKNLCVCVYIYTHTTIDITYIIHLYKYMPAQFLLPRLAWMVAVRGSSLKSAVSPK